MRLHKYIVDGKKVFILEEGTSRPTGNISLQDIKNWHGYAQGENSNVVIKGLENPKMFSKAEAKVKKDDEEEVQNPEPKRACVSKILRDVAAVAYGLDSESFHISSGKAYRVLNSRSHGIFEFVKDAPGKKDGKISEEEYMKIPGEEKKAPKPGSGK